jgi:hypothetical protein
MNSGELRVNRIKSRNRAGMAMLDDILSPEVLHARVPRLASVAEARQEFKNRSQELSTLGKFVRADGFDPTRTFQHVMQIDQSVWSAVLEVFARYTDDGELMDDGLLYVTNDRGQIGLNKPFFYALLSGPLQAYDMRGKIKLQ